MQTTRLNLEDVLPLTCSRAGTCCHGNIVLLNPWELFCLAREKKITTREFRDLYTDFGGTKMRFNGKPKRKGKQACSQYTAGLGCSVHMGRPLACRLFPIGRQIHNCEVQYMHEGIGFPCLDGCPEVSELPSLSVGEYLQGQETERYEMAQDLYLELMQDLADIAFELFLDTGLADSGETKTLFLWEKLGIELPEELVKRIGNEWVDRLMIPEMSIDLMDPMLFVQQHAALLQSKAQGTFGALRTNEEFHEASVLMMGVALLLAQGIGANRKGLAEHWVETAKEILKKSGSWNRIL